MKVLGSIFNDLFNSRRRFAEPWAWILMLAAMTGSLGLGHMPGAAPRVDDAPSAQFMGGAGGMRWRVRRRSSHHTNTGSMKNPPGITTSTR